MRTFGLIGRSLAHSFSQAYFTRKFAQLGLADIYSYELFELPTADALPALLVARPDLAGLNVTIPYKEQLRPYLGKIAPSAAKVGAVNVVEFTADGVLIGHNTDYVGFRESLLRFCPLGPDCRALVLGTGGAAKAVATALKELDVAYQIVSRTAGTADLTYADLSDVGLATYQLIINTTPLGTYPAVTDCPPLPYATLGPQHYLFDLVYNPAETEFMRRGRAAGAHAKNGYEMLTLQAEAAWAIWNRDLKS